MPKCKMRSNVAEESRWISSSSSRDDQIEAKCFPISSAWPGGPPTGSYVLEIRGILCHRFDRRLFNMENNAEVS